ncbi:hypothetical protein EYC84_006083 [Monilinia fructicola]|uniref:Zn(2)-C6 fungal-type domain-containing protein n=1 Tax=Monilinia fructicola TaxID=38448 RepID=A0A5M9K286_MONFR|nr:hypothetical protein EYC84_006083 [Monilinia fructicola]
MEDENETSNVQLTSSEHEHLIEERSDKMSPITESCEETAPNTPVNVPSGDVTPGGDSSDLDLRSDHSPSNEIPDIEVDQQTPDSNTAEDEPQERKFPKSFDLALQLPKTEIPEPELSERKLSEPEISDIKSPEVETTQSSETSPQPVEIEVPQISSPSPKPIEIGIPEQSGSSPEPIEIDIPEQSDISTEIPDQADQLDHEPQDHSGSDADNECSDDETPRALGEWQLRQLAENALEIALEASTPKPSSPSSSNSNTSKPRTPLPERVWRPSTTDPTQANKPKCPPCERKKKRFDCLGNPPCNECSKRNMTAEQCASYAPVRRRGKRRMQDDDGMVTQKGGKRGKRR